MSGRQARRLATCRQKRRYPTWDEAERAAMDTFAENPSPKDENMAHPYPCDAVPPPHYHYGHLRFRPAPTHQPEEVDK